MKPLTDIQRIFLLSKTYGGFYLEDDLPRVRIEWPRGWMTKRIEEMKERQGDEQR